MFSRLLVTMNYTTKKLTVHNPEEKKGKSVQQTTEPQIEFIGVNTLLTCNQSLQNLSTSMPYRGATTENKGTGFTGN